MANVGYLKQGLTVAVILAVLTVLEYIFAVEVSNDHVRFAGLAVTTLLKTWAIVTYFMHFTRMWKGEVH
jgi:cytochrome c oxidase subunit IV